MTSPDHQEPDEATVRALGKLSEALETIERARGSLYSWHQLTGKADFELGDAVDLLARAGHQDLADELSRELVGRNVLPGRWSFQAVEEYDDSYYEPIRDFEKRARSGLADGRRHLFEARLKEQRRTHGHPHHTAGPDGNR
ncbi:hypothetical protein [Actinomadura roseirufa]|uniref:hypothetical protein n=1 Tax=Actinomadura roseirufa TaxID=2094049 RepID=UPI00104177DC|nr:hypothetical protein [Actinomadura roseirufa]